MLNIAANQIKIADNFTGLYSLIELNLRRNKIEKIVSFKFYFKIFYYFYKKKITKYELDTCTKLQRLFLSYNEIQSLLDINNLNNMTLLQELTLDNNPICNHKNYKRNIIGQLLSLKSLDTKRITVF